MMEMEKMKPQGGAAGGPIGVEVASSLVGILTSSVPTH
jgi:hypothetical protein